VNAEGTPPVEGTPASGLGGLDPETALTVALTLLSAAEALIKTADTLTKATPAAVPPAQPE
jgi:hypothetical protein